MLKCFLPLCVAIVLSGFLSAQKIDPANNPNKKDQYAKSAQQAEQQSQDEMKKQNDDFVHKKKYKGLTKKGKPANTGKAKPESLLLYIDKTRLMV